STTTRVGSPPVWESTTLMRRMDLRSLLPAGEQSIQQWLEDQDGRAGDHREEDEEQEEVRLSAELEPAVPRQRELARFDRVDLAGHLAAQLVGYRVGEVPEAHQERDALRGRHLGDDAEARGRHAELADRVEEIRRRQPEHRG